MRSYQSLSSKGQLLKMCPDIFRNVSWTNSVSNAEKIFYKITIFFFSWALPLIPALLHVTYCTIQIKIDFYEYPMMKKNRSYYLANKLYLSHSYNTKIRRSSKAIYFLNGHFFIFSHWTNNNKAPFWLIQFAS